MVTEKVNPNGSKLIIIHDCNENVALEAAMHVGKELKDGECLAVLVQTENPVGVLMHVRKFEKEMCLDEIIKELLSDMYSQDTVFSGADYIIKKCGKHPREFLLKLL